VTLRYFDCRSRGQALRFALHDSGIQFEDERVPVAELAAWRNDAADPRVGGPFASLPVLQWDGHRVAQTLAIAGYLGERLGLASSRLEARSRDAMVGSVAHLDMQVPYSGLLWLAEDTPDAKLAGHAHALHENLAGRLVQLERLHEEEAAGPFFRGDDPGMGDFFAYESIDRARAVFGARFETTLSRSPRMGALFDAMSGRPGIAAARATLPDRVTASPSEPKLRERIPGLVAAAN
jgi:glutathione S-transferase